MARKKFSPLITIINLYNNLSVGDKVVFEELIRSQQPLRKNVDKGGGEKVGGKLLKLLQEKTGASKTDCKQALIDGNGELNTAEILIRKRNQATVGE